MTSLLRQRVLILDGAMGTTIQRYSFDEKQYRGDCFVNVPAHLQGNHDLLTLSQPHAISKIHRTYLDSGSDIVEITTLLTPSGSRSPITASKSWRLN